MEKEKIGKGLLTGIATFTAVGGFLMDYNKTHLFNPAWTPHAKFHDAMTILLGSFLGGGSLYLLQRQKLTSPLQLKGAVFLPAFFFAAQAGAFAFPGAKGLDAEFPEKIPQIGQVKLNEMPISLAMLAGLGIGYWLTRKTATSS